MLELKNVTSGYGRADILKNVNLALEHGKLTSIIGPNGCGKSTLLRTALGILPCRCGEVTVDKKNIKDLKPHELARRVSYLSQERRVPDMTVEELVLNGRFSHLSYPRIYTDTDKKIAREAMERMSIDALAGTPLSALSGGMRQSAYIAMILAQDSDYVLLDEPLTYLDISHQLSLMRSLKTLVKEGRGIITVMHDLPLAARFSDEIVLMNNGSVIESLPPSELVSLPVIEELFSAKLVCNGGIFSYQY